MTTVGPFSSVFRWRVSTYELTVSRTTVCSKHGASYLQVYELGTRKPCMPCCIKDRRLKWWRFSREWGLFGRSLQEAVQDAITDVGVQIELVKATLHDDGEATYWL